MQLGLYTYSPCALPCWQHITSGRMTMEPAHRQVAARHALLLPACLVFQRLLLPRFLQLGALQRRSCTESPPDALGLPIDACSGQSCSPCPCWLEPSANRLQGPVPQMSTHPWPSAQPPACVSSYQRGMHQAHAVACKPAPPSRCMITWQASPSHRKCPLAHDGSSSVLWRASSSASLYSPSARYAAERLPSSVGSCGAPAIASS